MQNFLIGIGVGAFCASVAWFFIWLNNKEVATNLRAEVSDLRNKVRG